MRTRRLVAVLDLALLGILALASPAAADLAQEEELAERYAPVVRLVEQAEECGPGRAVRAARRRRALRRADRRAARPVGRRRPRARSRRPPTDLGRGLYEYHLDFPGDALDPGLRLRALGAPHRGGRQPTVYAHVAADPGYPGQLALQYWLFYAFNDWNNLHEGDWEMIQLVFDAATRRRGARRRAARGRLQPARGRASGPTGATTSSRSSTARTRSCTRRPARTRTSSTRRCYLGALRLAGRRLRRHDRPARRAAPGRCSRSRATRQRRAAAFPWIDFEGRWGELPAGASTTARPGRT